MIRLFTLITICLFYCCSTEIDNKKIIKNTNSVSKINIPVFNEDSAYFFIQKQVDFGPRFLSSIGWEKCSAFLENKLKTYTENVLVQEAPTKTYDNKKHTLKNIIASFSPEKNNRIALMAHWDTRPIADYDTINQNQQDSYNVQPEKHPSMEHPAQPNPKAIPKEIPSNVRINCVVESE